MRRANVTMTLALLGSLSVSAAALVWTRSEDTGGGPATTEARSDVLVDAAGNRVRLRHFARIASNNLLTDRLLLTMAEPERVVGLSSDGFSSATVRHLYGARAKIDPQGDIEALLQLKPDLLLVNTFADHKRIARLREAHVVVFDLGEMRGVETLVAQIEQVGALLGAAERGRALRRDFLAHMRAVAADIPRDRRKPALYVGAYGSQLYGGARGTSYHDVLEHAGLIDVAATKYADWPAYTSEQLLALDPEVIVTAVGQRTLLCEHQARSKLRACGPTGQVVQLDSEQLVDPGLTMLEVAVRLREAVYGTIPPP